MSGSLYSVSDKALYDALNQYRVTKSDLRELFLSRGIIISHETDREILSKNFSRFTHGYEDYELLSRVLGTSSRREKTSVTDITSDIDFEELEASAYDFCDSIGQFDANAEVNNIGKGLQLIINYRTIDFNKSEFKQIVNKEAIITVEKNSGKITVRSPLNDIVDDMKAIFLGLVEKNTKKELQTEEISLDFTQDPSHRTKFFTDLIENLNGYDLVDVTDVYVYHPNHEPDKEEEEEEDVVPGVHISKATLKGVGVLQSSELKSLYKRGFYIWKIIWQCKNSEYHESDLYEFEAQFADPDTCTRFSYLLRGFYKYKAQNEYNKSKTQLSTLDEFKFNPIIEASAKQTIDTIIGTII